jgi:DNA-binding transcriptional regulator YiaG
MRYQTILKSLRDHLQISQEGLAELLGVHKRSVSRWERGVAVPSDLATKAILALLEERGLKIELGYVVQRERS